MTVYSPIKKKKNVAFHMWSNRCLKTNTDIHITERYEWEKEKCLYMCEYMENSGAINV